MSVQAPVAQPVLPPPGPYPPPGFAPTHAQPKKHGWLWGLLAIPAVGAALVLASGRQGSPNSFVPQSVQRGPQNEDWLKERDGIYAEAQDRFGPIHIALLEVKGSEAKWYRFGYASSTDQSIATIEPGAETHIHLLWPDRKPREYFFTGSASPVLDGTGKMKIDFDYLAPCVDLKGNRLSDMREEFVLKKTHFTSMPRTVAELISDIGPPEKVP